MKHALAPFLVLSLAACAGVSGLGRDEPEPVVLETVTAGGPQSVAADPTLSETDMPEVMGEPRFLGFSVTRAGDESLPGLWLETPLVREEMAGRVIGENGRQIELTLRPKGGARGSGSFMSIAAFTALGLPMDAPTTLTVAGY